MHKKIAIRWGDLDANRHVANTSYVAFMNETRMSFFLEQGFRQSFFEEHCIGPVLFSEEHYYLREIYQGDEVYADMELLGHTEDFKFVRFAHCLFNGLQELSAYCEVLYGWIDLNHRKLVLPPPAIVEAMGRIPRSERFAVFSEKETRHPKIPSKKFGGPTAENA